MMLGPKVQPFRDGSDIGNEPNGRAVAPLKLLVNRGTGPAGLSKRTGLCL